jgi:hypothetical protein
MFKFGYEYRHLIAHPDFSLLPTGYQYYYGSGASLTSDPTYAYYNPNAYYYNRGNEIADLLLGLPGYVAQGIALDSPKTTSSENSAFFQDRWRVAPRLTLEYGVRYEYQAPYQEGNNRQANLDLTTRSILLAGAGGSSAALIQPDLNNFAPRAGLAWQPLSKTVIRAGYGLFYTPEDSARSELLTRNYPFYVELTFSSSAGSPFAYLLDSGAPRATSALVPPGTGSIPLSAIPGAGSQVAYYIDPNFWTGYSQMFNFTVQREIASDTIIDAGYVGALAHKLPFEVGNINLTGRVDPLAGQVEGLFSEGNSSYHSLQVKAERRFHRRYSFLASYTFAKNMDNGPAPLDIGLNHQYPQRATNLSIERALSSFDARHNLVTSFVWLLPGPRESRLARAVLGGWQLSGILALRSGLPVNVVRNSNLIGYQGLRPNVNGDPNLDPSERTLARYFDTQTFSVAGLGKTQAGDAGRNIVTGPGSVNLDASLFRNIRMREGATLQLRIDAFNLSNTPHFANPNSDLSQGSFGSITQTIGNPRILQFAGKLSF